MFQIRTAKRTSYPKNLKLNRSPRKNVKDNVGISKGKKKKQNIYQAASPYLTDEESPQVHFERFEERDDDDIVEYYGTSDENEMEEDRSDDDVVECYATSDDDDGEYSDFKEPIDYDEEDDDSDTSSKNENFLVNLNTHMSLFQIQTDRYCEEKLKELLKLEAIAKKDAVEPGHSRSPNCRRKSILPGSEMCKEVLVFNDALKSNRSEVLTNEMSQLPCTRLSDSCASETAIDDNLTNHNDNSLALPNNTAEELKIQESIRELVILLLSSAINQMQLKELQSDSRRSDSDHIDEFASTVHVKPHLIRDIQLNFDVLQSAKEKFQMHRKEWKKKINMLYKPQHCQKNSEAFDIYISKKTFYEERLQDVERLSDTIDNSVKAISMLFDSVQTSTSDDEMMHEQMSKQEEREEKLKKQIKEDKKRFFQLAEELNITPSILQELNAEVFDAIFDKELHSLDFKIVKKNLSHISERLSHLDLVLKEKSVDLGKTMVTYEKKSLRDEIHHLRRTRDWLLDRKCDLDKKHHAEKALSNVEKRKQLEFGEAIEAIDAMIEHKNEMICGKNDFTQSQSQHEKGEAMLMERLAKLSNSEMKTLFYKYFLKVIDLKESSQMLELRTAELEGVIEGQKWRIETLTNALKLTKLAGETHFTDLQDQYQRDLLLLFKHFSEDTGEFPHEYYSNAEKLKRKNKSLAGQIRIYRVAIRTVLESNNVSSFIKDEVLKILNQVYNPSLPQQIYNDHSNQGYKNTTTTKVTRQRNKLIIQKTTDSDKKKK